MRSPNFLNDLRPDVDVFVAGRITRLTSANEARATAQNLQDAEQLDEGLVRTRQFDLDLSAIILAVAVLAIGATFLIAWAPTASPAPVPLATPILAVTSALAGAATPPATRRPRVIRVLAAGCVRRFTWIVRVGGDVLFLIAWGLPSSPIVG